MKKKRLLHTYLFVLLDFVAASIAWVSFFVYRKYFIEPDKYGYQMPFETDTNFYLGMFYVPLYWIVIYYLAGHYKDVWKRSRIKDISATFSTAAIGVVVLFFLLLLDDEVKSYKAYYYTVFVLFTLHFSLTVLVRIIFSTYIKSLLQKGIIKINTLLIGSSLKAKAIYEEILASKEQQEYSVIGYISDELNDAGVLAEQLPCMGNYNQLIELINKHEVEEVIIAIESSKHQEINKVTNILEDEEVTLKIVPDIFDVMSGSVKMKNVLGTALIEINHEIMPQWQKIMKRVMDIAVSFLVLLFFSPLFIALAFMVKISSKGPIFFKQIRIGYKGKPFSIIKYRSMYTDAELDGPALSSKNDKRITPIGQILRKYRLDELPQFWNILIGEMSLVGPRPERKFFIDQIIKIAPHYKHLHRAKPGLTSWGQVKYGYAENVEQMVERLKFDILYIENMSIAMDIRILIYTVRTILLGKGK